MYRRTIEEYASSIAEKIRKHLYPESDREPLIHILEKIRQLARERPLASAGAFAVEADNIRDLERDVCKTEYGRTRPDSEWPLGLPFTIVPYIGGEWAFNVANQLRSIVANLETAYENSYAPRNADDVFRVEKILHEHIGLPLPLVWQIIEDAEYWVRSAGSCAHLTVTSDDDTVQESLCCKAMIPSYVKDYKPLRRIVFTIYSHDQGWQDDDDDTSWTWFEAGSEAAGRRVIVHNVLASRDVCMHRIHWDLTSPGGTKGSKLHEWMSCFTGGQELSVFACAQYEEWKNHVRQVVVEVYCACV